MKTETFIKVTIFSLYPQCTRSPKSARTGAGRQSYGSAPSHSSYEYRFQRRFRHFISHKICSLWSRKPFQPSALEQAGQAGFCPHTTARPSCAPSRGSHGWPGRRSRLISPARSLTGKASPTTTVREGGKQGGLSFQSLFWSFLARGAP